MIPLSEPRLNGKEWTYVKDCLDTGWVSTAGKYVERLENKISSYTKCKYAVAVNSGTSALQIALQLVGVGEDDEVIVPTVTFIAPVNAIRYHRAYPVFMDCDDYYNIDVEKTTDFILKETVFKNGFSINRSTKRKVKAVLPVHVFGNAAKLHELTKLCRKRNIKIVEDATESLGTFYKTGEHSGTLGDVGCLSFNGNKIITAGGGGMILTNTQKYAQRAHYWTTQAKDDALRYIHNDIGFNFRLNNLQAAMGVAQLESLSQILKVKKRNYECYKKLIDSLEGLRLADAPDYAHNNYWMYALQLEKKTYGCDKEALLSRLNDAGIQSRPLWYLNHLQKPFKKCQAYHIKKAKKMLDITLNIPCSATLKQEHIKRIGQFLENKK
ncbi:MAG: LegC family aminotransferase [Candidatus Omnitrophica bacterium]|nr:LegC family aminotransferase [Candidatus Omnitrophota bacterium]